jgi:hypothetical protein
VNDPVVHGTADNNPHEDGAQPNDSENKDLDLGATLLATI